MRFATVGAATLHVILCPGLASCFLQVYAQLLEKVPSLRVVDCHDCSSKSNSAVGISDSIFGDRNYY